MSLFSSIGSAFSNAYNAVKNYFSGTPSKSQTAAVGNITTPKTSSGASGSWNTNTINAVQVPQSVGPVGSASYNAFVASNPVGTSIPVTSTISARKTGTSTSPVSNLAQSLSNNIASSGYYNNPVFSDPSVSKVSNTISANTYNPSSNLNSSLASGSINGGTLNYTPSSITLPSSPNGTNYNALNQINNQRLANAEYGTTVGPDGTIIQTQIPIGKTQTPEEIAAKEREQSILDRILKIPQKENILQSPEIVTQNAEIQRQRQVYNDLSSQLNAVINKQTQDINFLDKNAETEGVTKTVYGNQVNEINRQATLRALPIQSAMALQQGNIQLAENYLQQLTAIKTEAVNNAYNYEMAKYNAINDYVTKEQAIKLEALKTKETRKYEQNQELVKVQESLLSNAIFNKAPQAVINAINMATTSQEAIMAAGDWGLEKKTQSKDLPLSILDIQRYQELYPQANVVAGDTEAQANAKVAAVSIPEKKIENLIVSAKDNNNSYETVVNEINNDPSIVDKTTALDIAKKVYGVTETISKPVYGSGRYASIPLEQELKRLQDLNIKLGIGKNTGIREDLVKAGYPVKDVDKMMHPVMSMVDSLFDSLFKPKNFNSGAIPSTTTKQNSNLRISNTEEIYPTITNKMDLQKTKDETYKIFPFTNLARSYINEAKLGILPKGKTNSMLIGGTTAGAEMIPKGADFHNFIVKYISPVSKKVSDFILNNTNFIQNLDKANINITTTDPTILAHEMLHQYFQNSPLSGLNPDLSKNLNVEKFGTSFLETWDNISNTNSNSILKVIDKRIQEDYNTEEMFGSDLATERFAYLGELVGKNGVNIIPKELRPFYKQVFNFK